MTDTTTTQPAKKMWTRCTGCKQRIYNEPLDIQIHAPLCPQNMLLAIQKLNLTVFGDKRVEGTIEESLVFRFAGLEQVIGNLDEQSSEPTVDPDGIDEDAYEDVVGDSITDPHEAETVPDETVQAYQDAVVAFGSTELVTPAIDRPDEPISGYQPL